MENPFKFGSRVFNTNQSGFKAKYGADTSTFWMITTGVPGCATPQPQLSVSVKHAEEGSPLGN
jgi:hypothetical protein